MGTFTLYPISKKEQLLADLWPEYLSIADSE